MWWCSDSILCCLLAVKYERIKFLVVALKDGIEIYAWAPKPYHKFMAFKVTLKDFSVCVVPTYFYRLFLLLNWSCKILLEYVLSVGFALVIITLLY